MTNSFFSCRCSEAIYFIPGLICIIRVPGSEVTPRMVALYRRPISSTRIRNELVSFQFVNINFKSFFQTN